MTFLSSIGWYYFLQSLETSQNDTNVEDFSEEVDRDLYIARDLCNDSAKTDIQHVPRYTQVLRNSSGQKIVQLSALNKWKLFKFLQWDKIHRRTCSRLSDTVERAADEVTDECNTFREFITHKLEEFTS